MDFITRKILFKNEFMSIKNSIESYIKEKRNDKVYEIVTPIIEQYFPGLGYRFYYDSKEDKYVMEFDSLLMDSQKVILNEICTYLKMGKENKNWKFEYYRQSLKNPVYFKNQEINKNDIYVNVVFDKKLEMFGFEIQPNKQLRAVPKVDRYVVSYMLILEEIGERMIEMLSYRITIKKSSSIFKKSENLVNLNKLNTYLSEKISEYNLLLNKSGLSFDYYKTKTGRFNKKNEVIEGYTYIIDLVNDLSQESYKIIDYYENMGISVLSGTVDIFDKKSSIEQSINSILSNGNGLIYNISSTSSESLIDCLVFNKLVLSKLENIDGITFEREVKNEDSIN